MKKNLLRPSLLALSITLFCGGADASMVRSDVNYQYFRDFAENKGQFHVGASNVPIFNKQGNYIGTVLPNVPMADFSVISRQDGVATLFHPQYVTSVKHNTGYGKIQFGADGQNPDNHYFDYLIVDRNNHPDFDIHAPRLHKLVTEVAPISLNNPDLAPSGTQPKNNAFTDKNRYPYFVRAGSGRQVVRDQNGNNTFVYGAYQFLTGGTPMAASHSQDNWAVFADSLYNEPLSTYALPGDSGSSLFAYDAKEKRWVLVGVLSYYVGEEHTSNTYTVAQNQFMNQAIKDDEIDFNVAVSENYWRKRENNQSARLKLYNENLVSLDTDTERPSLAHGKTVHFHGKDDSSLTLQSSINQGAGALYFNNNMTVKAENNDYTWQGAGIVVNDNKTVYWGVKNPEGDRLSKLGTGTLYVNGKGKNLGDISVGDGTVVLDQQALNGEQQAFNQVGITSGRGTVVLANANQVNPDNIYFGFRGGRLDLNGNVLTFNYIQNADDGAQIVNHNKDQASSLIVQGQKRLQADNVEWGKWSQRPTKEFTVYEYINTHKNNRLDYFRFKEGGSPTEYFPLERNSSNSWEFLGNDKSEAVNKVLNELNTSRSLTAFSGFLGESDRARHNGVLNVTFRPTQSQDTWLLNGGSNINGALSAEKGTIHLSGIPTPHAYDYLTKTEVIQDNDWINRQFTAREFNVSGEAKLTSGRNVSKLEGNFNARQQGQFNLGFVQGESAECIRSTFDGQTTCRNNAVLSQAVFNQIPATAIYGNVNLREQSQLNLGKAHLVGRIQADNSTQINLKPQSQWTMTGTSEVGNLSLSANSQITINSKYDEVNSNHQGQLEFNQLRINNQLTGTGHFRFLTNLAEQRGDNILVNGLASGAFLLSVKNTGKEPSSSNPLGLVKLANPNQDRYSAQFALENGYADLGAYRYVLLNRNNEYRLYNPLKEAEQGGKITAEQVYASKREFESVKNQLEAKKQELDRLIEQYSQEKARESASNKESLRLSAEIRKETANQNTLQREVNRASRNPTKRQQLQQQLNASKDRLAALRNELNASNQNVQSSRKQMQQITRLQNEAKSAVRNFTTKQNQLQRNLSSLESSYAESITRVQEICAREGISTELCNKVSYVANENGSALLEDELNMAIEQMEAAQQALERAENSGNVEAIAYAQQRLNEASTNLLNRLENAYSTLAEIEQFLATQADDVAMPVQAQLISRYANTAVSELSANVNAALQIGRNIDRALLDNNHANVWANTEFTKQNYHSDFYRPYKQTLSLTQLGVAYDVNEQMQIGAVLSHSRGNNTFDENISGKNRLTAINAFVKNSWNNGIFASIDLGYGRSRNTISFEGNENVFHRNIFSIGANTGVRWGNDLTLGINVQPSIGVRYYRLSRANYSLSEAQVATKALHLTTYRAGIELDKSFDLGDVQIKPSLASYYYDTTQRKLAVNSALSVNNVELNQQFGRYFNHELGLSASFNQWQISTHIGILKGSDINTQKYAAFKLGYSW